MAETIERPAEETIIDAAAFIKQRNENAGKPVDRVEAAKPEVPAQPEKPAEPASVKVPRHIRRENNRLREEAAELRGKLAAYEALREPKETKAAPPVSDDPEPNPSDFSTDAEYNRALGKWEARQEASRVISKRDEQVSQREQSKKWQEHLDAMAQKAVEDSKQFPDWDEKQKAAEELDFNTSEHPALLEAIAGSDLMARIWYHFAGNPEEFERFFGEPEPLRKDFKSEADYLAAMHPLASRFKRLEGKLEVLYSKPKEAAEASDKPKGEAKDRVGPEKTEQARATAADRDVRKPRPSTEVAARGGSAPPEEPPIGSKAWMEKRNAVTGGR